LFKAHAQTSDKIQNRDGSGSAAFPGMAGGVFGDALAGQHVGLFAFTKSFWSVHFLNLELGHLHCADRGAMRPAYHVRPQSLSTMQ
jgi:hypothetical protein